MIGIGSFGVLFVAMLFGAWNLVIKKNKYDLKNDDKNVIYIFGVIGVGFLLRVILAAKYMGHSTDMNCFMAWSNMIYNDGISNFYVSDAFTDYPPGYMYVLYGIGAVEKLFGFRDGAYWMLVKLPAIICDILTGIFIYRMSAKRLSTITSATIAAIYIFNPAVITNSSLWGQVDSVYTLITLLMICLLSERKLIKAYFAFAICIFIKPQAFIFTPLIVYAIIENVFMPKINKELLVKNLVGGLCAIAMIFVLALPFGIENVVEQYKTTLASYPYLTVNAFNVWGAFGQNWTALNVGTTVLGYIILVAVVVYASIVFFKTDKSNGAKYYFVGALLSFSTYMFSTKMHDRYAFPMMILFLTSFAYVRDKRHFIMYSLASVMQYFNTTWVLFIYEQDINKYFKSPVIIVASMINIAIYAYVVINTHKYYVKNRKNDIKKETTTKTLSDKTDANKSKKEMSFIISEKQHRLKKSDYALMMSLMLVYSVIAFYHLGDMKAPQTMSEVGSKEGVTIDLGGNVDVADMKIYLGPYQLDADSRVLEISYLDENMLETATEEMTSGSVFCWNEVEVGVNARYIKLITTRDKVAIEEIGIRDTNGELLQPVNKSDNRIALMFDEQELVPERSSYMNGTYFDEIYHARTAYEFIHHLSVYEWTHPPLGKVLMSLGIRMFGMTPFGWRIVGTLFGVFMIPIIYLFAARVLKNKWLTMLTTVLLTFDFMHFAQTRIATIDVYVTFFIMLMYYFMYKYSRMSFNDTPLRKTLVPLALSGVCMGLGIASKWTGMYAGAGLAVIFFVNLYKRYKEYLYAQKTPNGETDGIKHSDVCINFKKNVTVTVLWCVLFFMIIPLGIYVLSYIPYLHTAGANGLKTIIENQKSMWTYHSKTVVESTHPFSSRWYEWIIMKRPIWYYSGTISDTVKEGISSFGNPLVWWMGIPAFFYMVYLAVKRHDKVSTFLVIAYLAQLLPWIPVERTTYIYHYFPCVPFLVLMIGYSMKCICAEEYAVSLKNGRRAKICCFVYVGLVVMLFAMFYPVLSGAPCNVWFAEHFLKWFNSWVLL